MSKLKVIGLYLAAGKSSRFGSDKLIAPIQQKPLGAYSLEAAIDSMLNQIIIVTKNNCKLQWMTAKIKLSEKWMLKKCVTANNGFSYSLKCGLFEAEKHRADAVIVMLADQPLITNSLINILIETYIKNSEVSFVGVNFLPVISPPILISTKLFNYIYDLEGDCGAIEIIRKQMKNGILLNHLDICSNILFDVDTISDYEQLKLMLEIK